MPSPIFILASPRSGTTLLRTLLDAHPSIAALPELNHSTEMVRAFDGLMQIPNERRTKEGLTFFEPMRLAFLQLHRHPRDVLAAQAGKTRWVDNTHTTNDNFIDAIDTLYDGHCQIVVLLRHGADVVASQKEKFGGTVEHWAARYAAMTLTQHSVLEQLPERSLAVRYRDLVTNPEHELRRVLLFLEEDHQETTIQAMMSSAFSRKDRIGVGDHKILETSQVHTASLNTWTSRLTPDEQRVLHSHPDFVEALRNAGYSLQPPYAA